MKDNKLKVLASRKPMTVAASTAEGTRRPYAKPNHYKQAPTAAANNSNTTGDANLGFS
jgi:hypothetical protein